MEKGSGETLVIWFKDGQTAFFENVTDLDSSVEGEGCEIVSFKYFGVSTQVERLAIFNLDNIAGFATEI